MGSSVSTHNGQGCERKPIQDTQAAILRLILEIEAQAGQKIRGLEYSMCEGGHYKPQYMQVEAFMLNHLSLETLGAVAVITE